MLELSLLYLRSLDNVLAISVRVLQQYALLIGLIPKMIT
jgi:hypothetical protein